MTATRRNIGSELGARLREARTQLGLTSSHVAAHAGIDRSWLCRIERGHGAPSMAVVEALVAAMALQGTLAAELRQAGLLGVGHSGPHTRRRSRRTAPATPAPAPDEQAEVLLERLGTAITAGAFLVPTVASLRLLRRLNAVVVAAELQVAADVAVDELVERFLQSPSRAVSGFREPIGSWSGHPVETSGA